MAGKQLSFYLTCAATWCFVVPALLIFGGLFLIAYALLAEIGALMFGSSDSLDGRTAREIARRMCVGS